MVKIKALLAAILILSTLPLVFCACGECEHIWDESYVAKAPTDKDVGYTVYTCKECGETKTEEIAQLTHTQHDYSKTQWGSDETHHWLICDYEDCEATTGKHEHTWTDNINGGQVCQVCRKEK